ncbi:MAG TPA: hypothetical protein QGF63_19135 [Alphaproteobacteria bacterium]|nr:hypothetical protein [Alphaproteobacteria bacterium]HJM51938.1 hypothetical protein [Alphaproteobacteria bacterium]
MLMIRRIGLSGVVLALLWWPAALAGHLGERYHVVDGLDVHLGITAVEQVKDHPGVLPKGKNLHHVLVALFDRRAGQRVDGAEVAGRVSELGLVGNERVMAATETAGAVSYCNYFAMSTGQTFELSFSIRLPGQPRVHRTTFVHRHQH